MNRKPELLLGIIIVILIIVGIIAYVVAAPHAHAPTTATSTVSSTTQTATTSSSTTTTYTDPGKTFSFTYPTQFNLSGGGGVYSQDWMVNSSANGMLLVKVTIPQSFEPKTNFVDANFTVGVSAHPDAVASCLTAPKSGGQVQKSLVTINGVAYTKYVSTGAAAGNLYETTSYRTLHGGQCYALEYTIHSGNIQNYPAGAVAAFDHAKIQNVLEGIVQSFTFRS